MRTFLAVGATFALSCGMTLAAPPCFSDEFQAAATLYQARRYELARTAFVNLAEKAPSPRSKAECLALAASSLARTGKYEQALALANTIEIKPLSIKCRMGLMLENKDDRKLIAEFKDEPIGAWPESSVPQGYYLRGMAYLRCKDYQAAANDLDQAVRQACDAQEQIDALLCLAGTCRLLNNTPKAVEAYRKALTLTPPRRTSTLFQIVIGLATLLNEQGEHDEALTVLKRIDVASLHGGDWHASTLLTYGAIYEALGRTNQALASYRGALSVSNVNASLLTGVTNTIDRLTRGQGGSK